MQRFISRVDPHQGSVLICNHCERTSKPVARHEDLFHPDRRPSGWLADADERTGRILDFCCIRCLAASQAERIGKR